MIERMQWEKDMEEQYEIQKRPVMSKKSQEINMNKMDVMGSIEDRTAKILAQKRYKVAQLERIVKENDKGEQAIRERENKEKLQKKVKVNTKEFELAYARKLAVIEEKKLTLAKAHAEKKRIEEDQLHTFTPSITRPRNNSKISKANNSRSKRHSIDGDACASRSKSPNEPGPNRMETVVVNRKGKVQTKKSVKVEDRLTKQGHDKNQRR